MNHITTTLIGFLVGFIIGKYLLSFPNIKSWLSKPLSPTPPSPSPSPSQNTLIKCYEITPATHSHYDSTIVRADNSWKTALQIAEESLDNQFLNADVQDQSWPDIHVTIRCIYLSKDQIEEIEQGDN